MATKISACEKTIIFCMSVSPGRRSRRGDAGERRVESERSGEEKGFRERTKAKTLKSPCVGANEI